MFPVKFIHLPVSFSLHLQRVYFCAVEYPQKCLTVVINWIYLSLCSDGHFPGGPGLAGTRMSPFWILLELRVMEVVSGNDWSYKTCKAPVKMSPATNQPNTQFYRLDALPVIQPAASEHWRETLIECMKTEIMAFIKYRTRRYVNTCCAVHTLSSQSTDDTVLTNTRWFIL